MKILLSLMCLLCFISIPMFADDVFSHPVKDSTRTDVVAVTSRMASHPVIKASFELEKKVSRLSKSFVSTGTMIFSSEYGLLWEVKKPFASTTIMTKDKIIQKTASGTINTIPMKNNDTAGRFSRIMQAVFNGDFEIIQKEFDLFFYCPAGDLWTIGLKPKDKTLQSIISSMEIHGKTDLEGFVLHESNGDSVTYTFSNISYPQKLTPADEKAFF